MSTPLLHVPSSGQRDQERGPRGLVLAALGVVLVIVIALSFAGSPPPEDRAAPVRMLEPPVVTSEPDVVGYLPYWDQPAAIDDALREPDLLTVAAPWWYSPTSTGGVVLQHRGHTDTGSDVVDALRARGLDVMPTIANHHEGEWDFEVVPELIADDVTRAAHVRNLVELVSRRDYDGIVIDYELLGAGDRDNFTALLTELGAALHAHDRQLAVALHAQATDEGSGDHNVAQDYRAIGRVVEQVHLMTYDEHYDESEPGPIAPLPWVTDVLDYATARIPPEKLVLGIGLYGYDWGGGDTADDLQLAQVARRIDANRGEQGWDQRAAAPWFRYDDDGVARVIWYEDVRSVQAKLDLVSRYDLGGAFIWRLGGVPDDIWWAAEQTLRPET
jgi:spore germination protein